MTNAFDNYPPWEVEEMLEVLWAQGPEFPSNRKIVEAVQDADAIEAGWQDGSLSVEAAEDGT